MYNLVKELFPITRSLTGEGNRTTLNILKSYLPSLELKSVKSGTKCFDWEIPKEWSIKDGYIQNIETNEKFAEYKKHNLHIVGYSQPVDKIVTFEELKDHIFYKEELPEAIPYVTSYYKEFWGFCMSYEDFKKLDKKAKYRVFIDSNLFEGVLNYGELYIPGQTEDEVLFSTYICHPSMANNELSGPVLATYLAMYILSKPKRRYSYRFLFTSETIGTIYYISRNLEQLKKHVKCGFVLTCVGDEGDFSYLPSRYGNTLADKLVLNLLNTEVKNFKTYSYLERGSDEREYCFPGVDLPLCLLMKSKFGKYKEYHTSLDNLDFVTPKGLQESYDMYVKIIETLENNYTYKVATICEPFMSKYGLYETISFRGSSYTRTLMNFLVYSDGNNDLIDIANLIKESAYNIIDIAHLLEEKKLINKVT